MRQGSCASCTAPTAIDDVWCSACGAPLPAAPLPAADASPIRIAAYAIALIVAEGAVFAALLHWTPAR